MVTFKVRVYHKQSDTHEVFHFLTVPNRTEVALELLKLSTDGKRSAATIKELVGNVRKYKMPTFENAEDGGSSVTQWYNETTGSNLHIGYLDIEGIMIVENHHQPMEPENMVEQWV